MEVKTLQAKLEKVKKMGYVVSMRKGNTGIGYTLETLLGIVENNIKLPDFGTIELKSKRKNASTPVTMFTFNKAVWKIKQIEVIKNYGYKDTTGRLALYCFVGSKPNPQGLYLKTTKTSLQMYHNDGTLIAEWQADNLAETFRKKMPALVLVQAETRVNSDEKEEFYYNEAYLLSEPSGRKLLEMISKEEILVDIRMHVNLRGSVRNHGTAFRTDESKLMNCFNKKESLL
ncbi:MAG TPA: MvaI/BcnI family restriction endonuclease [Chitinophagales bacterium]|nr:MvaI/BcnI family restriction endonuclease [Chitinophagales bacterium]